MVFPLCVQDPRATAVFQSTWLFQGDRATPGAAGAWQKTRRSLSRHMKSQSCHCTSASLSRGCTQAHIQQSLSHPDGQEPAAGTATSQGLIRKPRSPRPPAFGKGERQLEHGSKGISAVSRCDKSPPSVPALCSRRRTTQHDLIRLDSCLCGLGQQRTRSVQISTTKPWQA